MHKEIIDTNNRNSKPSKNDVKTAPPAKITGLYIDTHKTQDKSSKSKAENSLRGWKKATETPQQWIEKLESGQTIQPSDYDPTPNGTFTHSQHNWIETFIVAIDADNIRGVEFTKDGEDKNPKGVDPFTDEDGILTLHPELQRLAYAIGQSVSSMSEDKPPPHRRYRIILLFNKPIRTKQQYYAILNDFAMQFAIIPRHRTGNTVDLRSPTQPVFGNARKGYNKFQIYGNVLNLDNYPEPETPLTDRPEPPSRELTAEEQQNIAKFTQGMGIVWTPARDGKTGKLQSQYFEKRHCKKTKHKNPDKKAVQFHQHPDGSVDGHCYGCHKSWYIIPPPQSSRSPTLQIDSATVERNKNQLSDIDTITTSLENAISEAIAKHPDTRKPHIIIMKYDTGIGKTMTTLTKAHSNGKKVLSLLHNHDLAQQQNETAAEIGYTTARFKGRGYEFANSGLAHIPVRVREEDETLFQKHGVMCPLYDKIKPYSERRISPWIVCFGCPLRNACQSYGFWSQFKDIQQADYVSICKQDAIFNPDMWTFLNIILTGKIPFEETESDEEKAIAAMFGLDTSREDTPEFKHFDMVIIDDYHVSDFYAENNYTMEEIGDLAKNWENTHTGKVISEIYNALILLWTEKDTQPTIKALRKILDSLDEDEKQEINETLTEHPIRHDDHIEVMRPWEAIQSGISLYDISPVWYHSDWTILHQLETMIHHTQNETQAPLFLDPQTANLTIITPPQLHPTIKVIVLLSATAEIEGTKEALTGQKYHLTVNQGQQPRLARGVQLFQFVDSRFTQESIFEIERDAARNKLYETNGKPKKIGQLTTKAENLLKQLIKLVKQDGRKALFTSYKEFTEEPYINLSIIKQLHSAFTIRHYDQVAGHNYDDYKIFINFGYPKIEHKTIVKHAKIQHAHDPKPLSFEYEAKKVTESGYTAKIRTYKDNRVEKIRQQLIIDKLKQTTGRGRQARWENTIIINICAEPVPTFTEIANPITTQQIMEAETLNFEPPNRPEAPIPMQTTAEKVIKFASENPQMTQREIARLFRITTARVSQIVNSQEIQICDTILMYISHENCVTNLTMATLQNRIDSRGDNQPQNSQLCRQVENSTNDDTFKGNGDSTSSYNSSSRNEYHKDIQGQILNFFQDTNSELKTSEITKQIAANRQNINSVLSKMVKTGQLEKPRHGVYRLLPNAKISSSKDYNFAIYKHKEGEVLETAKTGESYRKIALHCNVPLKFVEYLLLGNQTR